jgi:hypothetical protein
MKSSKISNAYGSARFLGKHLCPADDSQFSRFTRHPSTQLSTASVEKIGLRKTAAPP